MIQYLKKCKKENMISLIFYFQHILKFFFDGRIIATVIGNLDPVYLLAPIFVWRNRKNLKKLKILISLSIALVLFGLAQIILLGNVSIVKLFATVFKIVVCLLCTMFIIQEYRKINFLLIAKLISILYAISLPFALFFKDSPLFWVTNDIVNKYTTTRLRFFYYEPSELGFRVIIVLVILIGFLIVSNSRNEKIIFSLLIGVNLLVLYLCRSMGAICIGLLSVLVMLLFDAIVNKTPRKTTVYVGGFIAFLILAIILISIKSPIYMRLIDTFNGKDSSNNYRIGLSYKILLDSFSKYYGLGCGLGNVNTEAFMSQYKDWGMITVITNSFVYYVVESGIFGVVTLFALLFILARHCFKDKSAIKWGLFIFVVTFQLIGGYFTNGLNWVIYGIILSPFNERNSERFKNTLLNSRLK